MNCESIQKNASLYIMFCFFPRVFQNKHDLSCYCDKARKKRKHSFSVGLGTKINKNKNKEKAIQFEGENKKKKRQESICSRMSPF